MVPDDHFESPMGKFELMKIVPLEAINSAPKSPSPLKLRRIGQ
jgi:hypothetical protein